MSSQVVLSAIKVGDNHLHLNPIKGMGVREFAKRFLASGGWFTGLVNLTSWSYGVSIASVEDCDRVYRITLEAARELREQGLQVAVMLGLHPAELARLVESGVNAKKAATLVAKAYEIAASYVRRGEASGLGEAGRPHWPAPREVVEVCNTVLDRVIGLALELDCVVHLHVERGGRSTVDDLAARLGSARKVVLHHAEGVYAGYALKRGLVPSVPAKEEEIMAAIKESRGFVVESDFLDDPKRPGAVVAPWSISRTFAKLISRGALSSSDAERVLVKNIEELYGVECKL